MSDVRTSVKVFCAYARADESYLQRLETHLAVFQRQGLISFWHDRRIVPGTDWEKAVDTHLNSASVILLLISPKFLASKYCSDVEMKRALERHRIGEARVIPILLRPVDWTNAPFAHLQALPTNAKPITKWRRLDEAFADVAVGIRWAIEDLGMSVTNPSRPTSERDRLVHSLQREYSGLLTQLLKDDTMMTPRLHERPDVIHSYKEEFFSRIYIAQESPLPSGTSILQAYNNAEGHFLLLGKPGTGKTTLLFYLALELLTLAQSDPSHRIPVILNLSSWANQKSPLRIWLIDQLPKYSGIISHDRGKALLEQDQLLLLLDGLDEVEPTACSQCIEAINAYQKEHTVPLVVCSRSHEYQIQKARLVLPHAVEIQPLQEQEVMECLERLGESVAAIRAALPNNRVLNQLLTIPLMLSVVIQTYQGTTLKTLPKSGSLEEQQQQIFEHYVKHRFEIRTSRNDFTFQQTCQWFTWLAGQMKDRHLTEFYLEWLQPTWLPEHAQTSYRVFSGLLFGLLYGLGWLFQGLAGGLVVGLSLGLFFGLLYGLQRQNLEKIDTIEALRWSKLSCKSFLQVLFGGLLGGLGLGLLVARFFGLFTGLVVGLLLWLVSLSGSTVSGVQTSKNIPTRSNEGIRNSGRNALRWGSLFGLSFGLVVGLLLGLVRGPVGGLFAGLWFGLGFGLISALRWGGEAYLKHYILRYILKLNRVMPWHCVSFLEEATERILLQRAGRGYCFIHSLFRDYFASLKREESSNSVRQSSPLPSS